MTRAGLADYGHAPSPAETSLLRCIVRGDAFPPPVVDLVAGADAAQIEPGIARLLPALRAHPDLKSLPRTIMDLIVARHRESTCRYLALKASLGALVPRLAARGIEVLLLKGFPLAALYYQSVGARPMADLDMAVRPVHFEAARRVIERVGFAAGGERRAALPLPGGHAVGFRNADGLELDLHAHVLRASRWDGADDAFWSGAVRFPVREHVLLTLCAADHLLQTCLHGLQRNDVSPVRWVVDAARIVERGPVDWRRLIEQTGRHECAGPVRACLGYLQDEIGLPIPPAVLEDLDRLPRADASDRYFRLVALGPASVGGPRHWLARLIADHARLARGQAAAGRAAPGLVALAASKLELDGWRALPVVWQRLRVVARRRNALRRRVPGPK